MENLNTIRFHFLVDEQNKMRFDRDDTTEPRWAPSLADSVCPPYVKIDLSEVKTLPKKLRHLSREWVSRLVNSGVQANGKRYYVSGATQSTKSGVIYAYTEKNFWPTHGFSQPKDAVRGGAAHAPAYDFCGTITAPVRVNVEKLHMPLHEDGQIPCTLEFAKAVGIRDGRCFQGRTFVKGKLIKGVWVPLTPVEHKDNLKDVIVPDMSVRAEDIKGDGDFRGGTVRNMPFAVLDVAEAGTMDVGHQTANYWPQALLDAYATEYPQIAAELHDLAKHPHQFERYADMPLRSERSNRIEKMALLGWIVRLCIQTGNDDLLHSPGVQAMLNDAIIAANTKALFGNITSTRLLAIGFSDIPMNEIWVHPADAPGFVKTGDRAGAVRMPDPGRKENEDGTHEPVWPTVKVVLKEGFYVRLWGRTWWVNLRGVVASNPATCAAQALDFDGDWLGIIWDDKRPLVTAWLDLPNPTQDGIKRRAKPTPASELVDAIEKILRVDVSAAFGVKRKAVALLHKALEAGCTELAQFLNLCIIPILEEEGQKGVDNAKKQSLPDMDLIEAISSWLDGKGELEYVTEAGEMLVYRELVEGECLTVADTAWALIGQGKVKPWQTLTETEYAHLCSMGVELDEGLIGKPFLPSHFTSPLTPLGRVAIQLGNLLPIPEFDAEAFGLFTDRLPLLAGPGADEAQAMYETFLAGMKKVRAIPDAECREEAVRDLMAAWEKQCFCKQRDHTQAWNRQFVSKVWNLSFKSASSKQAFLWSGMVETLFEMLDEQAKKWKPATNRAAWSGEVYGVALQDGTYTVSCSEGRKGKNGVTRQCWTLVSKAGTVYNLMGGDHNGAWSRRGEFVATVHHKVGVLNHLHIAGITATEKRAQTAELKRLDKALEQPTKRVYPFLHGPKEIESGLVVVVERESIDSADAQTVPEPADPFEGTEESYWADLMQAAQ